MICRQCNREWEGLVANCPYCGADTGLFSQSYQTPPPSQTYVTVTEKVAGRAWFAPVVVVLSTLLLWGGRAIQASLTSNRIADYDRAYEYYASTGYMVGNIILTILSYLLPIGLAMLLAVLATIGVNQPERKQIIPFAFVPAFLAMVPLGLPSAFTTLMTDAMKLPMATVSVVILISNIVLTILMAVVAFFVVFGGLRAIDKKNDSAA